MSRKGLDACIRHGIEPDVEVREAAGAGVRLGREMVRLYRESTEGPLEPDVPEDALHLSGCLLALIVKDHKGHLDDLLFQVREHVEYLISGM